MRTFKSWQHIWWSSIGCQYYLWCFFRRNGVVVFGPGLQSETNFFLVAFSFIMHLGLNYRIQIDATELTIEGLAFVLNKIGNGFVVCTGPKHMVVFAASSSRSLICFKFSTVMSAFYSTYNWFSRCWDGTDHCLIKIWMILLELMPSRLPRIHAIRYHRRWTARSPVGWPLADKWMSSHFSILDTINRYF